VPARPNDAVDNLIATKTVSHLSEHKRAGATHLSGVVFHHLEVGTDGLGEIGFVDDKKICLRNARSAFPGNFIATGDINDLDREVSQFPAETGGEVVTTRFDEQHVRLKPAVQLLERQQVRRNVLTNRSMRTTAGLDGTDAFGGKRVLAGEELAVFTCKDVIGNNGDAEPLAQPKTELQEQGGFAASNRATHADSKGALAEVTAEREFPFVEMTGMTERIVGMSVVVVMRRMGMELDGHGVSLALEQTRIEPILSALPDV
jgi:hypothetical protein